MSEVFNRKKDGPAYWYNKSSDLLGAAGAVWACQDPEMSSIVVERLGLRTGYSMGAATGPVYHMLCGLALELLFKAIITADQRTIENTHNLVALAAQAGLQLTEKESGLLRILSEAVVWAGRYPIPVSRQRERFDKLGDLVMEHLFDEIPGSMFRMPNHSLHWDSFKLLWEKAADIYWTHYRKRYPV